MYFWNILFLKKVYILHKYEMESNILFKSCTLKYQRTKLNVFKTSSSR